MSEEEKKAIELLKDFKRELNNIESYERADVEGKYKKILIVLQEDDFDTFQTILNLIEKQQKEIERLNFENHMVKKWNEQLDKNCISKDKIKELKEKVEKEMISNPYDFSYMINELLEEN